MRTRTDYSPNAGGVLFAAGGSLPVLPLGTDQLAATLAENARLREENSNLRQALARALAGEERLVAVQP